VRRNSRPILRAGGSHVGRTSDSLALIGTDKREVPVDLADEQWVDLRGCVGCQVERGLAVVNAAWIKFYHSTRRIR
jgi:hypothetical protein